MNPSMPRSRPAVPVVLNARPLTAGGSICVAAPNAATSGVAITPPLNTQHSTPTSRGIRLLPASSPARIGFTTTAPKSSLPVHLSHRRLTTPLTNQCPDRRGASHPIGSDGSTNRRHLKGLSPASNGDERNSSATGHQGGLHAPSCRPDPGYARAAVRTVQ
jgi:hypothetical protein